MKDSPENPGVPQPSPSGRPEDGSATSGAREVAESPSEEETQLRKDDAVRALKRADTVRANELLFEAWDHDRDGLVALGDVEAGIEKLKDSEGEAIHLQYVAVAAADFLEKLASPADQRLSKDAFKAFVQQLTDGMGKPFNMVSELLIVAAMEFQPLLQTSILPDIKELSEEQTKHAKHLAAVMEDPQVEALFALFSSDSGRMGLTELCWMLHKLRRDVTLREARAQAVSTMLLCDTESKRSLDRLEFTRLLQRLASLLHMEASALAGVLVELAKGESAASTPDDASTSTSMSSRDTVALVYESLADRKLHLLFELWDKDGDGLLSFSELALGMRKFCPPAEPITETAADAAEAMLLFDVDADQRLDRSDFAWFINQLCEACGSDFNTLAEFLILLAALEDNPPEELAFLMSEDKVERAVAIASTSGPGPNPFAEGAGVPPPSAAGQRGAPAESPFADAPAPAEGGPSVGTPLASLPEGDAIDSGTSGS